MYEEWVYTLKMQEQGNFRNELSKFDMLREVVNLSTIGQMIHYAAYYGELLMLV